MVDASVILMEETIIEDTKEIEDPSDLEDLSENPTKAPIPNVLESQVDNSTKTKLIATNVKNLATCRKITQNRTNPAKRTTPVPRNFKIIPIPIQDLAFNPKCKSTL